MNSEERQTDKQTDKQTDRQTDGQRNQRRGERRWNRKARHSGKDCSDVVDGAEPMDTVVVRGGTRWYNVVRCGTLWRRRGTFGETAHYGTKPGRFET